MRVVSISILWKTALSVLGWSAGIVLVMLAAECCSYSTAAAYQFRVPVFFPISLANV
jgi:hypothetical protein